MPPVPNTVPFGSSGFSRGEEEGTALGETQEAMGGVLGVWKAMGKDVAAAMRCALRRFGHPRSIRYP